MSIFGESSSVPEFNTPADLFHYMREEFQYGIVVNGKPVTDSRINDPLYFFENYRTMSAQDFEKYKTGVCWDYVNYEAYLFRKHFPHIKFYTYYIELFDANQTTHTFLIYQDPTDDKWSGYVYFEVSFFRIQGMHHIKNIDEAFSRISHQYGNGKYAVYQYDTNPKLVGLNTAQFMTAIKRNGKKVDLTCARPINEGMIINKNDIKHNLSKWGTGEGQDNILYITGLSGSGKSTLSRELSAKHKCELLCLDIMDYLYQTTIENRFSIKALSKFPRYKEILNNTYTPFQFKNIKDRNEFLALRPKVYAYIIELMHKEKNKLFIIEGIQIFQDEFLEAVDIDEVPIIIKGTSVIQSILRMSVRNNNDNFQISKFIADIKNWFSYNKKYDAMYTDFLSKYSNKQNTKFSPAIAMENCLILQENYKTIRKYKCPYCDYRNTRMKLVSHIDKIHSDMIPEGYTAARLLYDTINTSPNRAKCRICGKSTEWNEQKLRYEVFCSDQCKKKYSDDFRKVRMVNKYGVETLLTDPEMQDKMLKSRHISGEYKFSDGAKVSYCGNYEKNLLEFLDKMMGYNSWDIMSPGPVIEYEYNGSTHFWITDQYIEPANLVIDCKDGGKNPNNRNMEEYRAKQIAKENAIKKLRKYNYIRLTDNDFTQLIDTLMKIKYEMMSNPVILDNPVIDINENTGLASTGGLVGANNQAGSFLIPYKPIDKEENDTEYALTFDKSLTDIYTIDKNGFIKHEGIDFLFDKKFDVIPSSNDVVIKEDAEAHPKDYFLHLAFSNGSIPPQGVSIPYEADIIESDIMNESIIYECHKDDPLNQLSTIGEIQVRMGGKYIENVFLREDINGYFLYDKLKKLRTASYNSIEKAMNCAEILLKM